MKLQGLLFGPGVAGGRERGLMAKGRLKKLWGANKMKNLGEGARWNRAKREVLFMH